MTLEKKLEEIQLALFDARRRAKEFSYPLEIRDDIAVLIRAITKVKHKVTTIVSELEKVRERSL